MEEPKHRRGPPKRPQGPKPKPIQEDFFAAPTYDLASVFAPEHNRERVCLVGCGKEKTSKKAPARNLYLSNRFNIAMGLADCHFDFEYIISAKHGLVEPDRVLSPYEYSIDNLDKTSLRQWAKGILKDLLSEIPERSQVTFLMENRYATPLIDEMKSQSLNLIVCAPLIDVEDRFFSDWHKQAKLYSQRLKHLRILYDEIQRYRENGKTFLLRDLSSQDLPDKGVYIFVDNSEKNRWGSAGRIVRIGTHAVSEGSKSLLRTRLRSHLGNQDGSGNHRGSIFRLHIGASLLASEQLHHRAKNWGNAGSASSQIKKGESWLEMKVSDYIQALEVIVVRIEDEASKFSLRAKAERQLIALLTEKGLPLEKPGSEWLGRFSDRDAVVQSGIWNVLEVGKEYHEAGEGSVPQLISIMRSEFQGA